MDNRKAAFILILALLPVFSGCGFYDREYVNIQDYMPQKVNESVDEDSSVVENLEMLNEALQNYLYAGKTEATIIFDDTYAGDISKDMQKSVWNLRIDNALAAYCLSDVTYDIRQILSYREADVHFEYLESDTQIKDIVKLAYVTGIELYIQDALTNYSDRIVILTENSQYSAEEIEQYILNVYRCNPMCAMEEPKTTVHLFSGHDNQRLYEILFRYDLSLNETIRRRSMLRNLDVSSRIKSEGLNEIQMVYAAVKYLKENIQITPDKNCNTLYDTMILNKASDEGVALTFVQFLHNLGINCEIVYGHANMEARCWNMVQIGSGRYHIDVTSALLDGLADNFIKTDEDMWFNEYRWDTSSYEACNGELTYEDVWKT